MLDFLKNSIDIKTYKGNVKQRVNDKSKKSISGGAKTNSIIITGVRLLKN